MRRPLLAAVAAWAVASGCIGHEVEVVPPGEFYVELDPVAGTVRVIPEIGARTAGLSQVDVVLDGVVGSNPTDTLEVVGSVVGYGTEACGLPGAFCADITLRSFFPDTRIYSTYVEVTRQTPMAGNELLATDAAPVGVGDYFGVYYYGLLDTEGEPGDTATRRWMIHDDGVALRLRARILGTPLD